MTPTQQALCREIAELEKTDFETIRQLSSGALMIDGDGYCYPAPDYFDPAETLRMLEALLREGFDVSFSTETRLYIVWKFIDFDKVRFANEGLPVAVLEAYAAMLREKA